MITVAQATEKIINRSRYLSEAISKGLINTSSLARYIKPELEQILNKNVSEAAVLMAINRIAKDITPHYAPHTVLTTPPQMILRSQLRFSLYKNTEKTVSSLLQAGAEQDFFLLTKHTNIAVLYPKSLEPHVTSFCKTKPVATYETGALTIHLPHTAINTPGMYYFFLKSLAWEGINILELFSVQEEITLVFEEKDASNAYTILQSLFT